MQEIIRTPDDRFADLPGFPYAPHYVDNLPGYEGLRAAYIDEGPKDTQHTFLCLHGEPTWSYLYRKMIPVFLASGARVVAPDLFGFGRSDKPILDAVYGFHFHRNMLLALVEHLDLRGITLVVQDWGGLIGLTLPASPNFTPRLSRLLVMNTTIATGTSAGPGFEQWKAYAAAHPDMKVSDVVRRGAPVLTPEEAAAYDAPFPTGASKAGVRAFPERVMVSPDMDGVFESVAAVAFWNTKWSGPSFMAWGGADRVFPAATITALRNTIRGCPEPMIIPEAGHFVQEWGEPIAHEALTAFGDHRR